MAAHNPYAPPQSTLEGQAREGYWREGKFLITLPGSPLPPRCVKCNEPAHEPTKLRKLYWHHPAVYFLIVLSILIYAIVALIVRKVTRVAPGLCHDHKRRRMQGLLIGWGLFILGLMTTLYGGSQHSSWTMLTGILVLLIGMIMAAILSRIVTPKRIGDDYVRFKGCGPQFLDSLTSLDRVSPR